MTRPLIVIELNDSDEMDIDVDLIDGIDAEAYAYQLVCAARIVANRFGVTFEEMFDAMCDEMAMAINETEDDALQPSETIH